LGSGSGLIINKLYEKVAHIDAVELFETFSRFIEKTSKISVFNQNITEFYSTKKYDLITVFGTMHHFNEQESTAIYEKYYDMLKINGKLIIKNQFGTNDDVIVEGYSEELKTNYFAHYRYTKKEEEILLKIGYHNIKFHDIYPPECNRWNNTHFYALVAEK